MTAFSMFHFSSRGAARIVTNSRFDTLAMALNCSLNWSTVSDIIRSETANC